MARPKEAIMTTKDKEMRATVGRSIYFIIVPQFPSPLREAC